MIYEPTTYSLGLYLTCGLLILIGGVALYLDHRTARPK